MTTKDYLAHIKQKSLFECIEGYHPSTGKYLLEYDPEDGCIMRLFNSEGLPINTIDVLDRMGPYYKLHESLKAAIRMHELNMTRFTVTKKEPSLFESMASIFKPVQS